MSASCRLYSGDGPGGEKVPRRLNVGQVEDARLNSALFVDIEETYRAEASVSVVRERGAARVDDQHALHSRDLGPGRAPAHDPDPQRAILDVQREHLRFR